MSPAPITLPPETERYFREVLGDTRSDQEPALVWTPVQQFGEVGNGTGRTFEGPAVILGWYSKGQRPSDSFFELCGHPVSIMPTTLVHIDGKTITRERFDTGFPDGPPHYYVLKVG